MNLMKGLDKLGYPYIVNGALSATNTLWIHDDPDALLEAMKLQENVAILAGPNIYTLPSEIPNAIDTKRVIWIHPASWVQQFWERFGKEPISSVVWPVGIDTELFSKRADIKKDLILVYNKARRESEVKAVCQALEDLKEPYKVITYGNYHESQKLGLLARSKAIVWMGRSESQGIGLLESLSMDVPALVFDVTHFGQWEGGGKEKFSGDQLAFPEATAIPYFDNTCGRRITDLANLKENLKLFIADLNTFHPREYILQNLSLAKQAQDFINLFKQNFNRSEAELRNQTLATPKKWKNAGWYFQTKTTLKDALRAIMG